jgi:hypothetical protein
MSGLVGASFNEIIQSSCNEGLLVKCRISNVTLLYICYLNHSKVGFRHTVE